MIRCPSCHFDFSPIDAPCKKCLGVGLVLLADANSVGATATPALDPGAKKKPCPRCNGLGSERSAANRHNRSKGAANEAKAVKTFTEWWVGPNGEKYDFKRTPQSGGSTLAKEFQVSGDICSNDPDFPFSVECKRDAGWDLEQLFNTDGGARIGEFAEQSIKDAPSHKIPTLWIQHPGPSQPTFIILLMPFRIQLSWQTIGTASGIIRLDEDMRYIVMSLKKFLSVMPAAWRELHKEYNQLKGLINV